MKIIVNVSLLEKANVNYKVPQLLYLNKVVIFIILLISATYLKLYYSFISKAISFKRSHIFCLYLSNIFNLMNELKKIFIYIV